MMDANGIRVERDTAPDGTHEWAVVLGTDGNTVLRLITTNERGARMLAAILDDYAVAVETY